MKESNFSSFEELQSFLADYQKKNGVELYSSRTEKFPEEAVAADAGEKALLKYSMIEYRCAYGNQLCKSYDDGSGSTARQCPFSLIMKASKDLQHLTVDHISEAHNHSVYPESYLSDATDIYKSLHNIPTVSEVGILHCERKEQLCTLRACFSQRDLDKMNKKKLSQDFHLSFSKDNSSFKVSSLAIPIEQTDCVLARPSPTKSRYAFIKKITKEEKDTFYLEVFSNGCLENSINLSKAEKHGSIFGGAEFSDLQWSSCETKVAYIAERKAPSSLSYFDAGDANKVGIKGAKFAYCEDWGEQAVDQKNPIVAICSLEKGTVDVVDCTPEEVAVSQICWTKDGLCLFFIGAFVEPFRLGKVYCQNRKNALFRVDLASNVCKQLTHGSRTLFGLKICGDGSKLVYLSRDSGGPHLACSNLMIYSIAKKAEEMVYEIVDESPGKLALFDASSSPEHVCMMSSFEFFL